MIEKTIKKLIELKKTISTMESCSGGALANAITNIPDASKIFSFGAVTYSNEYKIKMGDRYNYIDLLPYNIKYKCYVVVELKVTELNSNHTGQIQKYMNYIDKNIKNIDDNKTVGIIICKKENKFVIEYCSDGRIAVREYELV